jgi:hypothetical protein
VGSWLVEFELGELGELNLDLNLNLNLVGELGWLNWVN